jgi:hypothetical protein
MDLTQSIVPRSDQLNADDLMTGPLTVTITDVRAGNDEQPVNVVTQEFGPGRPFKPSKSMRRVMVAAWGPDSSAYVGRRMTIYRDSTIRFGKDEVGGIRISHMSHLKDGKRLTVALTVTRGKRAPFTVQPLIEAHVAQERADTQPVEPMTAKTRGQLFALFGELNIGEDDQRKGIAHIVGRPIESRADVSESEAQQVVNRLKVKKAERDANAEPVEPGLFDGGAA